jgi:site-specific recombinase XerD
MKTLLPSIGPRGDAGLPDDAFGILSRRFQARLEALSYAPTTVADYRRCLARFGTLLQQHGVSVSELDDHKAVALLGEAQALTPSGKHARFMVQRFVRFLVEQGVVEVVESVSEPSARDLLRRDYEAYLRRERGLSESTIAACWRLADRFLMFCFGDQVGDLSAMTAEDIAGFLHELHGRRPPYRVKTTSTHLRQFCRYLFRAGRIPTNLALGIPAVAPRYNARLRRHLSPEQVEEVLAAVRSETPTGRRNYAMVLLMARLGLRAPEVVAMRIDDIDWRAGEIVVRGKGQLHDRVPLPADVGEAIARYLRQDRVTSSRAVFMTSRAPYPPFRDGQILNAVLKTAMAQVGVKPPAPYVGSHVLRHSLAVGLIRRGASLDEIGDLLRHRSRASTLIYAKLDVEGLRSIAPPWPGPNRVPGAGRVLGGGQ